MPQDVVEYANGETIPVEGHRIYLSGSHHRRAELRDLARRIETRTPHKVVSKWIERKAGYEIIDRLSAMAARGVANERINQLTQASLLIQWPSPGQTDFELGYWYRLVCASDLARSPVRTIMVGPEASIYDGLTHDKRFETNEAMMRWLASPDSWPAPRDHPNARAAFMVPLERLDEIQDLIDTGNFKVGVDGLPEPLEEEAPGANTFGDVLERFRMTVNPEPAFIARLASALDNLQRAQIDAIEGDLSRGRIEIQAARGAILGIFHGMADDVHRGVLASQPADIPPGANR